MVASSPATASGEPGRVLVSVQVSGTVARTLWFDYPEEIVELVTPCSDPFAVALLLPAMRSVQDVHLEGAITDELLFQINGPVQQWVRSVLPNYARVRISADETRASGSRPAGVAAGFSAGIDSYSVIADYLLAEDVPDSLRITHLLFNDVGSHGGVSGLAAVRLASIKRAIRGWDVPLLDVKANIEDHLAPLGSNTAFQNTHTVLNAAVAHLLGGGIGTWLYASSAAFPDVQGGLNEDIGITDAVGLPLLSTSTLRLISVGGEYTRVEKTLQVAQLQSARQSLDVCIDADPAWDRNCSRCWKCLRTLLTLDLAGELDNFCPARFDKTTYLAMRESYLATVLASDEPRIREVRDFADQLGYDWPPSALARARLIRLRRAARRAGHRLKGRLRR